MTPHELWNWHTRKAGEWFFIPTLTPRETLLRGKRAAVQRFGDPPPVQMRIGIHKGYLGILARVKPVRGTEPH